MFQMLYNVITGNRTENTDISHLKDNNQEIERNITDRLKYINHCPNETDYDSSCSSVQSFLDNNETNNERKVTKKSKSLRDSLTQKNKLNSKKLTSNSNPTKVKPKLNNPKENEQKNNNNKNIKSKTSPPSVNSKNQTKPITRSVNGKNKIKLSNNNARKVVK